MNAEEFAEKYITIVRKQRKCNHVGTDKSSVEGLDHTWITCLFCGVAWLKKVEMINNVS